MASLPFITTPYLHFSPFKSTISLKTHFKKPHEHHQPLYTSYLHRISSLCKHRNIHEAVDLLTEMDFKHLPIGPEIYCEILQGCVHRRALLTGKQIHARILKNYDFFAKNEYIETKLVIFYAKCDVLDATYNLFRRLRNQNVFSWAAVIGLKCRLGLSKEALLGFCEMQANGFLPDNFVIPSALKACGALNWIGIGRGVHAYVVKSGFDDCVFVASSLVDMYGKCGVLEDARNVFDEMPDRNVVSWNSMIAGYVQSGINMEAIEVFYDMRMDNIEPTRATLSTFLSASANLKAVEEGKQAHAIAILSGIELDNSLGSSIVNMYSKAGFMEEAELVFSRIVEEKDIVVWNLLISGYVQHDQVDKALDMCRAMRLENYRFDSVTLASLLCGAANTMRIGLGKEAHCFCIRNNFESDVVVANFIVNMYAKCGRIDYGRKVFNSTIQKDIVLWTTLISGLARNGLGNESILFLSKMQESGFKPNVISIISVLSVCKDVASLRNGKCFHGYITRHNYSSLIHVATSLVDMYAKCGHIDQAKMVFDTIQNKELPLYNAMISAYGLHGQPKEAIKQYKQLTTEGIEPDSITFTNILSACVHSGMRNEGLEFFVDMVSKHGIKPTIEHYGCVVNLLSRCCDLDDIFRFVLSMPHEPDAHIIGSLLAVCREQHDIELMELLSNCLVTLEPSNSGNYVGISNGYAAARQWDKVLKVRDLMKEKGLRKTPGCSWIQIGEEVHVFVACDVSHPKAEDIYATLVSLQTEMCFNPPRLFIF